MCVGRYGKREVVLLNKLNIGVLKEREQRSYVHQALEVVHKCFANQGEDRVNHTSCKGTQYTKWTQIKVFLGYRIKEN